MPLTFTTLRLIHPKSKQKRQSCHYIKTYLMHVYFRNRLLAYINLYCMST